MPVPDGAGGFFFPDIGGMISDALDLEMNPDDVLELSTLTHETAEGLGQDEFRRLHLDNGMLGGFEASQAVVQAHGTAHAVVVETLAGVAADLTDFGDYLKLSVDGLEDADTLNASALERLAAIEMGDAGEQANVDARARHVAPRSDT